MTNSVKAAALSLQVSPHVLQAFLEPMRQASEWDGKNVKQGQKLQVSVSVQMFDKGDIMFERTHFNGECTKG